MTAKAHLSGSQKVAAEHRFRAGEAEQAAGRDAAELGSLCPQEADMCLQPHLEPGGCAVHCPLPRKRQLCRSVRTSILGDNLKLLKRMVGMKGK